MMSGCVFVILANTNADLQVSKKRILNLVHRIFDSRYFMDLNVKQRES